ncbi:hypothetical protein [Saccharolobus islandicus]|uniref:hypothetical protein n=1 Tax=Saccharolobus islandicus TaxID=43080 RepID=UPI001266F5EB|nr:hypothetical protein [Sulfolobus islandicus]
MNSVSKTIKAFPREKRYNIWCIKHHNLYLSREDFYKTIVHGHVLTRLRIKEFTPYGYTTTNIKGGKNGN